MKNKYQELLIEGEMFKAYLWKYRWSIAIFYVLFLLVWSPWLIQIPIRIDTETMINKPTSTAGWYSIGRQGALFTKNILGMRWFNPIFATLCGYLLIGIVGVLFGYMFWRISKRDSILYSAFGFICFTSPVMAEQFYFNLQIFEIAWAYFMCVCAVLFSYYGILKKRLISCILSVGSTIWIFSTYQTFVALYIAVVVVCFIFLYNRCSVETSNEGIPYWTLIFGLISLFLAAFVINSVITNRFFSTSDYLSGKILWRVRPFEQCISNVITHIIEGFLGHRVFYSPCYYVLAISTIVFSSIRILQSRKKTGWIAILAVIGLQITPFMLTILIGEEPAVRAQLVYPFVLGSDILLLNCFLPKHKIWKMGLALLTIFLCWTQLLVTERLIYTDNVRVQEDLRLVSALEQELAGKIESGKKVVFVGVYECKLNAACLRGQMIGQSIFKWDSEVDPKYMNSTRRICAISRTLGLEFEGGNAEQTMEARRIAQDMPCWPKEGSVIDAEDFIVVKLSEDRWPHEIQ